MPRPIDKITIQGFKSIRSLDQFELKLINILIGANGSGSASWKCLRSDRNRQREQHALTYHG